MGITRRMAKLPPLIDESLGWQFRAACVSTSTEIFYHPDGERGSRYKEREDAAKAVCNTCSVKQQCLDYALEIEDSFGVWGGMSEKERLALLVQKSKTK